MSGTSFRQRSLDGFVDICAPDRFEWNGLVALVHYGQVLDVLQRLDRHTDLNPAGSPVGEVVPTVGTFVDGVRGIGKVYLHDFPRPRPGEIGQVAFLLRVLVAVDGNEGCKDALILHRQNGFEG